MRYKSYSPFFTSRLRPLQSTVGNILTMDKNLIQSPFKPSHDPFKVPPCVLPVVHQCSGMFSQLFSESIVCFNDLILMCSLGILHLDHKL